MTLRFDRIEEGNQVLIFLPMLEVEVYFDLMEPKALCCFDFGMEVDISLMSMIVRNVEGNENKIRKLIEFELFHSFFHPCEDPNYTVLNWALYGNLKDRTAKVEH